MDSLMSGTVHEPVVPAAIARVRPFIDDTMRSAVKSLEPHLALIAGYQLGWSHASGVPTASGGKSIRPTLAVLSAEAVGGTVDQALPSAAAVELVHNFSLLHDDVMDGDIERRHRPTGWAVFGQNQAILAGSAMLASAFELLAPDREAGTGPLNCLLTATQRLIAGQSADLRLEQAADPQIADCLEMESGKTAALLACSTSIGAVAAGAPEETVVALAAFGEEVGMAFQLIDDVLGIVGDPAITGKSSSSDIRAGKRSAPVVAAVTAGVTESAELKQCLAAGLPDSDAEVARIRDLVVAAGGVKWATDEADRRLGAALAHLASASVRPGPEQEMRDMARYVVLRTS
jgi:geranylgeranyl diphosphate synthase, type I